MAINFEQTNYSGRMPQIWRGECKMLPGGFQPSDTFALDTVLYRGTPLRVDIEGMTAAVCKAATVTDVSTATAPRVAKGHYFAAGDYFAVSGKEGAAVQITAVDTSNSAYDVLTIGAAVEGLAAGDVLVGSDADGAAVLPNAIVGADKKFDGKGLPTIDAAYDALVLSRSLGYGIPQEWLQGLGLKENQNILFINQ